MPIKEPSIPFSSNPELRLRSRRLPKSELNKLVLANSIKLSPQRYLSKDSIDIAIRLSNPFASMQTIDDEEEYLQGLRQAMRYLHTLNVHYVLVHNVHYAL